MGWFDGGSHVSCVVHVLIHSFMCSFMWVYVVCVVLVSEKMGKEKAPISSIELMRWGLFVIVFFSAHHPFIMYVTKQTSL